MENRIKMFKAEFLSVSRLLTFGAVIFFWGISLFPVWCGEIYKWKDENGNIHFSEVPPDSDADFSVVYAEPDQADNTSAAPHSPQKISSKITSSEDTELIYKGPGSTVARKKRSAPDTNRALGSCDAQVKKLCSTMLDNKKSFSDRTQAAFQLGKMKSVCAARALSYGLDSQLPVAQSARRELLKIGPVAVGPLVKILEGPDFYEAAQDHAAYLLSQQREFKADFLMRLLDLLSNGDKKQQLLAARALWLNSDPGLVRAWILKLSDDNREIVEKAVSALARLKDKRALPKLLETMNHVSEKSLLRPVLNALVATDEDYTFQAVFSTFYSRSPFFRRTAISAFGHGRVKSAFPLMLAGLKDQNELIKIAAIHASSNFESPEVISGLISLLKDPSKRVVNEAQKQLKRYGPLAGAQLIGALDSNNEIICKRSALLLQTIINTSNSYRPKKILISPVKNIVGKAKIQQVLLTAFKNRKLAIIAGALSFYLDYLANDAHTSEYNECRTVIIQALEKFGDVAMVEQLYCFQEDPVLKDAAQNWYRRNIRDVGLTCIVY